MNQEKFLTVFAIFDDKTQLLLKDYQDKVLQLVGCQGNQVMDIPFHISLGTYDVVEEKKIKQRICDVCLNNKSFDIKLNKVKRFDNKVLFIEPKTNKNLTRLHKLFDNNVLKEQFPWHPHATIFIGEDEQVKKADKYLTKIFSPLKAKIVGIQMGEFFPTRSIIRHMFEK